MNKLGAVLVFVLLAASCSEGPAHDPTPSEETSVLATTSTNGATAPVVPSTTTLFTDATDLPGVVFGPGDSLREPPGPFDPSSEWNGSGCEAPQPLPDGAWFAYVDKTGGLIVDPSADWIGLRITCFSGSADGARTDDRGNPATAVAISVDGLSEYLAEHEGPFSQASISDWAGVTTCISRMCPVWAYVNDGLLTHLVEVDFPWVPEELPVAGRDYPIELALPEREATAKERPTDALGLWRDFRGLDQALTGPDRTYARQGTAVPSIAVGSERMLVVTNDTVAIFRKDGRVTAITDTSAFTRSVSGGFGAAYQRAVYDVASGRFFYLASGRMGGPDADGVEQIGFKDGAPCALGECVGLVLLAVSTDGSPESLTSADWYFYGLDWTLDNEDVTRNFSTNATITVTANSIVVAGRSRNYPTPGDVGYVPDPREPAPPAVAEYGKIRVIAKEGVLDGQPLTDWVDFIEPLNNARNNGATPSFTGAQSSPTTAAFLVTARSADCSMDVWRTDGPPSSPVLSSATVWFDHSCRTDIGLDTPQLEGPPINWAGSSGLKPESQLVLQGDSLWGARAVRGASGLRTGIHWFELDVGSWPHVTVVQSAVFEDPELWYHLPALTVDPAGNMSMIMRVAGQDRWPGLGVTGRLAGDPLGELNPIQILKEGDAPFDFLRMGYWSSAATDPVDGSMWLFGEYSFAERQWGTWIGQVWPIGFE